MFGLPIETITGGIGAAMGAYITMKAQSHAMLMETLQMSIAVNKGDNDNNNDAAKRSAPWLRATIGIIIIFVAFGGLLFAMWGDYPTTVFDRTPVKKILGGFIQWGGKLKAITVKEGFVIPPYIPSSVTAVVGFLFGAAAANVISKIRK